MIGTILIVVIIIILLKISSRIKNIENIIEKFYLKSFNDEEYIEEKKNKEFTTITLITIITIITLFIIFFKL